MPPSSLSFSLLPAASAMPPTPLSLLNTLTALLFMPAYSQSAATYPNCHLTFSCGAISNITFPFTGGDRPSFCGLPEFALTCRDNTITELTHNSVAYRVLELDQTQKTLSLSRSDLYNNTCPSPFHNTTLNSTLFFYSAAQNEALTLFYGCNTSGMSVRPYNLFSCNSSGLNFTDSYHLIGPVSSDPVLRIIYCSLSISVPMLRAAAVELTALRLSLGEALMQGFTVSYSVPHERSRSECNQLGGEHCGIDAVSGEPICICGARSCPFALTLPPEAGPAPDPDPPFEGRISTKVIIIVVVLSITGVIIVSIMLYCFLKRRHLISISNKVREQHIESFLLQYGCLALKRYKYSEMEKITESFKDKLGKGGYGSVYKGMLPNGCLVAVKDLIETDSKGEEFINEVASISRTSHVNIVSLLGFCYEGNKRALVYEYMPNKSLDKFLSNRDDTNCILDLEKLFKIAVGIAKGLEYLHTGCNTRIVHFDIKPQNILLDEDFCPKISDFGLAKLCKKKQSVLSLLGTRGTIGYIAPEMIFKNLGGASHKSDVYSYGMMILEMGGARKNVEEESSETNYFPDEIYEHVIDDVNKISVNLMIGEEEETRMKMLLVGFWCIQANPADRPSISKVVEMLEGSLHSIQIPPKPILFSSHLPKQQMSSSFSTHLDTQD